MCATRWRGSRGSFAPWTSAIRARPDSRFPYLRVRGEVALIGLNSGVPTAPLMASGRLGAAQMAALGRMLEETGDRGLARVIMIHHPPLSRGPAPPLRGLDDAREFERTIARFGAEAILHGHTHKRMVQLPALAGDAPRGRQGRRHRRPLRHRPPRAIRASAPAII